MLSNYPVLLTYNEEQNISRTLSHLAWAKDIVVVDSGSTDGIWAALAHFPNARAFSSVLLRLRGRTSWPLADHRARYAMWVWGPCMGGRAAGVDWTGRAGMN